MELFPRGLAPCLLFCFLPKLPLFYLLGASPAVSSALKRQLLLSRVSDELQLESFILDCKKI